MKDLSALNVTLDFELKTQINLAGNPIVRLLDLLMNVLHVNQDFIYKKAQVFALNVLQASIQHGEVTYALHAHSTNTSKLENADTVMKNLITAISAQLMDQTLLTNGFVMHALAQSLKF